MYTQVRVSKETFLYLLCLLVQKSSSGVSGSARAAWEEEETATADWGSGWNGNNDDNWNDDGKVKDNNYHRHIIRVIICL